METDGEKCYRLFGDIIDFYVYCFAEAEFDWCMRVVASHSFESDLYFVSTLPSVKLRIAFWDDKIRAFEGRGLIVSLNMLAQSYLTYFGKWIVPPHIFSTEEEELMWVVFTYLGGHRNVANQVPCLVAALEGIFYSGIHFI